MNLNEIEKLQLIVQKELNNRKVYEGAIDFLNNLKGLAGYEKELKDNIDSLKSERDKLVDDVKKKKSSLEELSSSASDAVIKKEQEAAIIIEKAKAEAQKIVDAASAKVKDAEDTYAKLQQKVTDISLQVAEATKNKALIDKSLADTQSKLSGLLS